MLFREKNGFTMKNNEVHVGRFVGKIILCGLLLWTLVATVFIEVENVASESSRSTMPYYLGRLQDYYARKDYIDIYSTLRLYDLYDEDYAQYWEICNAYQWYLQGMANEKVDEEARLPLDYTLLMEQQIDKTAYPTNKKIMQKWYEELMGE